MKRLSFWSMLMLMMMFANLSFAQVYSELDFIGRWQITDKIGKISGENYVNFGAFESVDFQVPNTISTHDTYNGTITKLSTGNYYDYKIKNLFVAQGNILHMDIYAPNGNYSCSVLFIIKSLTSDTMILESIDRGYSMRLEKSNTSKVSAIKEKAESSSDYYNLQGAKIKTLQKNNIYINNGKKIIK